MVADLYEHLKSLGQEHLLQFADELSSEQLSKLRAQIEQIDFSLLQQLHVEAQKPPRVVDAESLSPMEAIPLPRTDADRQERARSAAVGLEALLAGRVAVVLVAGGQGSRLGFEHPKGMFPIGPVTGASLFQIHAERILARSRSRAEPSPGTS